MTKKEYDENFLNELRKNLQNTEKELDGKSTGWTELAHAILNDPKTTPKIKMAVTR